MDDEWEEVIGGEDPEGGEADDAEGGVVEEDFEPLPPRRRRRTTGTHAERGDSSPMVGGTQVQGKAALSVGRPTLSSEVSRELNSRGVSLWTLGGTQVQRKVTSSLGRRIRDNLSSDASRDSNPPDKRLCLSSSSVGEGPSSPPTTVSTPGGRSSQSQNSDAPSGTPAKPVPRRFMKQEFVPPRNRLVYILAKKLVQAEVLALHPWPNTSTIESLVRRCWTNAIGIREDERSEIYLGANIQPPTKEPDEIALEIVSSKQPPHKRLWYNNTFRLNGG